MEGWHSAINKTAQTGNLPFYKLIFLLHQTSSEVTMDIRLIAEEKLKRYQRKTYRNLQQRIFSSWEAFEQGDITSKQLLERCSHLYGNAPVID